VCRGKVRAPRSLRNPEISWKHWTKQCEPPKVARPRIRGAPWRIEPGTPRTPGWRAAPDQMLPVADPQGRQSQRFLGTPLDLMGPIPQWAGSSTSSTHPWILGLRFDDSGRCVVARRNFVLVVRQPAPLTFRCSQGHGNERSTHRWKNGFVSFSPSNGRR
jgi:hypothetical protein